MPFSRLFVPDPLLGAVSNEAWIQAMLDVEAALARAESRTGLVPARVAEEIAHWCLAEHFDLAAIVREGRDAGNPAEPLVRALRRLVPEEVARYVHYGATSQDIIDTAAMLITKRALSLIEPDLDRLAGELARLADEHRDTLMVGRTLLQQALPMTFGLKAAGWLEGVTRAWPALRRCRAEYLAVQLGGAVGSLAALGDAGIEVLHDFARLLELAEPNLPWHTERRRIAEIGAALSRTAGTVDKIALDIILLAQTEIGEVSECGGGRRGGSSTMPQKHNPVGSVLTRASARQAQATSELLMRSMAQEHERAAGLWQAEWQALSDALAYTGGAVVSLAEVVSGLEVHPERMRANLDASRGLVMAERVSLLLSERVGREEAHQLIRSASRRVMEGEGTLEEVLLADDEIRRHLSPEEIESTMDPTTYVGAANAFIDRAITVYRDTNDDEGEGA